MQPCPNCGRYFKNKQSLRAHLKYCPLKEQKPKKEEIITEVFTHNGWRFEIKGKKGFMDILKKTYSHAQKKKRDTFNCLIGAIYSLYYAGIIQKFEIKPINR